MNTIRLILVDDHSIMREGLRMIIENDDEIEVCGEAGNISEALELLGREKPDLVLLDLDLGRESSLDHMEQIFAADKGLKVLVLTGVTDENQHKQVIRKGAHGIVLKNHAGETLLKAVKKVHRGEVWIDRTLTAKILSETAPARPDENRLKIDSLTNREREIVRLIAEGLVNKEIAARLFIGEKTVRNSLTVIYSKLEIANRLELAVFASHHGLDK